MARQISPAMARTRYSASAEIRHGQTPWRPTSVIMARSRLRKAALKLAQGAAPDGIDPSTQAVRSASIVLPEAPSFYDAAAAALPAQAAWRTPRCKLEFIAVRRAPQPSA
ncbi:MAG TPA: hypothetical protein VEK75_07585 [Xanthobacteraceae bacterium]|nr:hypothetical protein [Xanthobacteraceae bacterium]